jgi:ABC-type antimicrobial peptide transport system permease subunit
MSKQDYASQDLKRRPLRTALVMATMTTVVAATVFLFLFGNVLLDITFLITSEASTSSLTVFFEGFIWTSLILVLLLGAVVVTSTVSLEMSSRRKDIGLMKSIGTLMDTVFDHFMAQAMILVVSSLVLGFSFGTIFYLAGMMWLGSVVPNVQFTFNFPWVQLLILALIYIAGGYFAAQKPIYDAIHESPISAMNPNAATTVHKRGFFDSFGLSFRVATSSVGRKIASSKKTLVTVGLSIALASLLWVGGGVVQTTTDAYVSRAMGTNVVAIGNPNMLDRYYSAYSFSGDTLNDSFSYLDETDLIPNELVTELENMTGVIQSESRLVDYTAVSEGPAYIWNPETNEYERIGGDRTGSALIMGVDWQNSISDWYFEGEEEQLSLDEFAGTRKTAIGGRMANTLFEDPMIQSLGVAGASFDVSAVAFDILNGGMVAMISFSEMQEIWDVSGSNLFLMQLDEYDSTILSQIEDIASDYGFAVHHQQETLKGNIDYIAGLWNLLHPLAIMALASAFLSLVNYLLVSIFGRLKDYIIMRSVGAKPSFIARTMIAEGLEIGMKSGVPAIFGAILFSIYLLVPEAAVPTVLYLPVSVAVMLLAVGLVVVLAAIPVYLLFTSESRNLRVSEFSI